MKTELEKYQLWKMEVQCNDCGLTFIETTPTNDREDAEGKAKSKARLKHGLGNLNSEKCPNGGGTLTDNYVVLSCEPAGSA